jgi:ubiquitin-protein ligase
MAKKTSKIRLAKEMKTFMMEPPPYIPLVNVNEKNVLEWHLLAGAYTRSLFSST